MMEGDIFAIPRNDGGYYFVVHVASNRFGEAFGVLSSYYETAALPSGWRPSPVKTPVYTGPAFIRNGRWKRVEYREDVLEMFSSEPEIYHSKTDNPSNESIGPFGSGETPDGELRELEKAEAEEIGLILGTYRQIMLEEEFEKYLHTTVG
jgi:hypothetical protein